MIIVKKLIQKLPFWLGTVANVVILLVVIAFLSLCFLWFW